MIKLEAGNGQFDNISLVIKTICIPQTKGCRIIFFCHGLRKEYIDKLQKKKAEITRGKAILWRNEPGMAQYRAGVDITGNG